MNRALIIPAAGRGSRLQSDIPKVLYPIAGRPLIDHLFDLYANVADRFFLVLSPQFADLVGRHCAAREDLRDRIVQVLQPRPDGMLPAILSAAALLRDRPPESVWITWCDQVAVRPGTIRRLVELTQQRPAHDLVFPTVHKSDPYIHFDRDAGGKIVAVRHRREGDPMPEIGEGDSGLFALSRQAWLEYLPAFAAGAAEGAATGERNFLPFIPWMAKRGTVVTYAVEHEVEAMGVNTISDARSIEEYFTRS